MDRIAVGERIRQLRLSKGLTQGVLADKIGVARGSVARYEAGTYYPSQEVVVKLASVLGSTVSYILDEDVSTADEIPDTDIKFAVFGDPNVTDAQFEEVKQFARFIRERDKK